MWSAHANLNFHKGQVIAIRGARVNEYNGKTLNSYDPNSEVFLDPQD